MKKFLLISTFYLSVFALISECVNVAFEQQNIDINTSYFKSIDDFTETISIEQKERKEIAKSSTEEIIMVDGNQQLDFTPVTKVVASKKLVNETIEKTIIKKQIDGFKLSKAEGINTSNKELRFNSIKSNIIELDLEEKVQISKIKNIKIIERTNFEIIFEYQPKVLEDVTLAQEILAKIENTETPITIENKEKEIKDLIESKPEQADRISTVLAANEKSTELYGQQALQDSNVVKVEKKQNQDLVFFDYAAAEKDLDTQKIAKTDIKSIIAKEMTKGKGSNLPMPKLASKKKDDSSSGPIEPMIPESRPDNQKQIPEEKSLLLDTQKNIQSEYSISPYSIGFKNRKNINMFEVRFDDDIEDIVQSHGDGKIKISNKLNSTIGIRRGTVFSQGHHPTTVDFVLEEGNIDAKVPMFEDEFISNLLTQAKVTGLGGQLFIELDERTEDVEIDLAYEKKVYLDKNLSIVEKSESDYSSIMFLGVESGNTIITFRTNKNKIVSKIIHIEEDEIYYEPNFYIEKEKDEFDLVETYLLSKTKSPLSIDPKSIEGLTFDSKFKKLTNNRYQIESTEYPIGTRSYIRLKHLNESIYLGRWSQRQAEIPSEEYIKFVLDQFRLNRVGANCLIQVNLNKPAKEIYFNGQSKNRSMRMQANILDRDGVFYSELSLESEKVFLMGEEQGIVNIKITYTDNSSDYLQSYCSNSTYLVEQL